MDRDGVEVRKLGKKKISTHLTEKAWSIKNLFFGFRENVSWGTRQEVPSEQDGFILPTRVANQSPRFGSFRPHKMLAK